MRKQFTIMYSEKMICYNYHYIKNAELIHTQKIMYLHHRSYTVEVGKKKTAL